MQAGCPIPLEIVGSFPQRGIDERLMHERLEPYRAHGEWFDIPPALLEELLRGEGWPIVDAPPTFTLELKPCTVDPNKVDMVPAVFEQRRQVEEWWLNGLQAHQIAGLLGCGVTTAQRELRTMDRLGYFRGTPLGPGPYRANTAAKPYRRH